MQKSIYKQISRIKNKINYYLFKKKFVVEKNDFNIITLGSKYGGWSFVNNQNLSESTIISCGLGEDASFDIEFANFFNANVILVDPTPRAVNHFNNIVRNLGSEKRINYKNNGAEDVRSYDLRSLKVDQLKLVEKAIWVNDSAVNFYLPKNKSHVSHSIINFQNDYSTETEYIEVEAITLRQLIDEFELSYIPILKLDIEGAETEVVNDLLSKKIFPNQILIEYDEMQYLNNEAKSKIYNCHLSLLRANYKLININNLNFLYLKYEN